KDGYPVDSKGCKLSCVANNYCDNQCKMKKASGGHCYAMSCYCEGLPENAKVSDSATNICG
nr:Chain A, NEUROTOXIN V-5 [Centruroides sculpturatus]1I6G_A Chain A, NEUROTOXIN V-5 [Centruroides sculpturatus]1NH5_A Chain A, Neurotoxin 5 [Centruroides exilicauda]